MSAVASLVFAAGRGTRMKGYPGNKTLLPLIPAKSPYEGARPLIREVLDNLPPGPEGNRGQLPRRNEVRRATEGPGISFIHQPVINGTGGALLAAHSFLDSADADRVIITMGDVPLIQSATYSRLIHLLDRYELALLGFECKDRANYGMIETDGERVKGIVEWKYWKDFPLERQSGLKYCNAGVYAARRTTLLRYMVRMAERPHEVRKLRDGAWLTIKEYFLTDLAEMMNGDGLLVAMTSVPQEEATGVDSPESLLVVQKLYARLHGRGTDQAKDILTCNP